MTDKTVLNGLIDDIEAIKDAYFDKSDLNGYFLTFIDNEGKSSVCYGSRDIDTLLSVTRYNLMDAEYKLNDQLGGDNEED